MATVTELGPRFGIAPMCAALGVPGRPTTADAGPAAIGPGDQPRPRALTADERAAVLAVLHEPRFVDLAPAEVYATPAR